MEFVNRHLDKLGLSADDMESSFSDGCYLIMLVGQLDGFFVPLHSYYMPGKVPIVRNSLTILTPAFPLIYKNPWYKNEPLDGS